MQLAQRDSRRLDEEVEKIKKGAIDTIVEKDGSLEMLKKEVEELNQLNEELKNSLKDVEIDLQTHKESNKSLLEKITVRRVCVLVEGC